MSIAARRLRRNPALRLAALEDRTVPTVVINELYVNPPGTDDNREFIELRSLSGGAVTSPNLAVVEIQGNPGLIGSIASDVHLSGLITGINGLLLLGHDYGSIGTPWGAQVENQTALGDMTSFLGNDNFTVLLVEGYTGLTGQDLDTNDDGLLDVTPWTTVLDSVGWLDASVPGGKIYTPAALTQSVLTPDAASRFSDNLTPLSTAAWYDGEILTLGGLPDMSQGYDPTKASKNLPAGAKITPGAANFAETAPPPKISGVLVNSGAAQRSNVTAISVTFDQIVTLPATPADAFQLTRPSDGSVVTLAATVDTTTGKSVVTLAFSGATVIGGSLADGKYSLTISAPLVTTANGALDGNGDGVGGDDYTVVGSALVAPKLFRLLGDADGDGDVDNTDFVAFRTSFGTGPSIFDSDGDGDTDNADFVAFRGRFGTSVP